MITRFRNCHSACAFSRVIRIDFSQQPSYCSAGGIGI
jgi:hypothetical protein